MKPRILFLAVALTLAALPAQAQRELQESVAAAYEARAQAWALQAEALESDAMAYDREEAGTPAARGTSKFA